MKLTLRRNSLAFIALLVFTAACATGCSSTGSLGITGAVTPNATVGVAYTSALAAVSGSGVYTWSATSLPPGVTLSGTTTPMLTFSGTPTTAGSYTIAVTLEDSKGRSVTYTGTITVSASAALAINGTLPLSGSVGTAYAGTLTATGGTAPYTWMIANLPDGITAPVTNSATLAVSGSPTTSGSYQVSITLADSASGVAKSSVTVSISSKANLAITGALPATGNVGTAYSATLTAAGGTTPYTWSITNLPAGVTSMVSADTTTVAISGAPTTVASYNVNALVTDSKSVTALYSVTVVISAAQALADCTKTFAFTARGNESALNSPYAFVVSGMPLPNLPQAWAGGFTPNGSGGITAADADENSVVDGSVSYRVDLERSSYSYGADGTGCAYLAFSGANDATAAVAAHTPNLSLGGGSKLLVPSDAFESTSRPSGVLIEFVASSADGNEYYAELASQAARYSARGNVYRQTTAAFALEKLSPRFAFGINGWYLASASEIEPTAMAGNIGIDPSSHTLKDGFADNNIGGDVSGELTGAFGSLAAPSKLTGRGTGTYTVETPRGPVSFDFSYYVVSDDQLVFVSNDDVADGNFLITGQALAAASPAQPLAGTYRLAMDGVASGSLLSVFFDEYTARGTLNAGSEGAGVLDFVERGASDKSVIKISAAVTVITDSLSGRTTLSANRGDLPVAYRTADTAQNSIAAFLVGTDAASSSGTLTVNSSAIAP